MRTIIVIAMLAGSMEAAELRAGVAKADLDPPVGIPMAGYGPDRLSKGMLDPVEARVLALSDGSRTIALITLDLCFTFDEKYMDQIRADVRPACRRGDLFHASHTHSGPTYSAAPQAVEHAVPHIERGYSETAAAAMVPVQIGNGWGQTYIGFNRRYVDTEGALQMFWRNETKVSTTYPVDPTVGVIRIDRRDGTPLAILVNYACHPVILGPDSFNYSADYPGEMRRVVEQAMGNSSMAFFLQGAPGDINPYYDKTPIEEDALNVIPRQTGPTARPRSRPRRAFDPNRSRDECSDSDEDGGADSRQPLESRKARSGSESESSRDTRHRATAARAEYAHARDDVRAEARLARSRSGICRAARRAVRRISDAAANQESAAKLAVHARLYTNGYCAYFPTIAAAVRGGYGADSEVNSTAVGTGENMLNTGLISIYELLGMLK